MRLPGEPGHIGAQARLLNIAKGPDYRIAERSRTMLILQEIPNTGILYRLALPPLDAGEIASSTKRVIDGRFPGITLSSPQWLDLTQVDLLDFDADEIRKIIRSRSLLNIAAPGPLVLVVQNDPSFGMARMFSIYSDLMGVRGENLHCVSLSEMEAATWLMERYHVPDLTPQKLAFRVRALRTGLLLNGP